MQYFYRIGATQPKMDIWYRVLQHTIETDLLFVENIHTK